MLVGPRCIFFNSASIRCRISSGNFLNPSPSIIIGIFLTRWRGGPEPTLGSETRCSNFVSSALYLSTSNSIEAFERGIGVSGDKN